MWIFSGRTFFTTGELAARARASATPVKATAAARTKARAKRVRCRRRIEGGIGSSPALL
jgi:hypothetical protein